jgi:sigma-B regulation protein RsbU (phosphoserine phosphatase)
MPQATQATLRNQLADRRRRLTRTIEETGRAEDLVRLLGEVDRALERVDGGSFGQCRVCGEAVEDDDLVEHPLLEYCLCRLTERQRDALQRDLDLAQRVQLALLPKQDLEHAGWLAHHRYVPAGPVSGDFCDVVAREGDGLYFLVGDVSGKGVAAALLMARLSAHFRGLVAQALPVTQAVTRVNRFFGEDGAGTHFATLVCGRADDAGRVEVCNAGHCPPLVLGGGRVVPMDSTGLPVGIADDAAYETLAVELPPGHALFLYTDGLTEAGDPGGALYGAARLGRLLAGLGGRSPATVAEACLGDVRAFRAGAPPADDMTLMVLSRAG